MILISKFNEVTNDQKLVRPGLSEDQTTLWRYLQTRDRHLLELYSRGMSSRQIGEIVNMNGGSVSRRIVVIQTRLRHPLVKCLERCTSDLDSEEREIGRHHFIGGLSIPRIAKLVSRPPGVIRRQLAYLAGVLEEMARRKNRLP